jgi:hypothetical protein
MTMHKTLICRLVLLPALILVGFGSAASDETPAIPRGNRAQETTNYFNVVVPAHSYDLILARPEKNSITVSVLAYQDMEGFVTYGTEPGAYTLRTPVRQFKKDAPVELVMNALQANVRYHYQFRWRLPGAEQFADSSDYSFQTTRAPGSGFTYTMSADSHLDEHTSPDVYRQTLANIRADKPDFHIDLGNLFMTDKHVSRDEAAGQYLAERYYLGQIGGSIPLFLALGTHDGESVKYDDGSGDCLAAWSNQMRKRYFPNPIPDGFYIGNGTHKPH